MKKFPDSKYFIYSFLLFILILVSGCSTLISYIYSDALTGANVEEVPLPPPYYTPGEIKPESPVYRSTESRIVDLLHTSLDLKFDWEKQSIFGTASLNLTPYFYPTDTFRLDAKNMEIKQLTLGSNQNPVEFKYDGETIFVQLDQVYTKGDLIEIKITYQTRQKKNQEEEPSFMDFYSDPGGYYFINASNENPSVPQQIWTQGETEYNSLWFPTLDQPNERCTQEVFLTVKDQFKTLSNGKLISSISNPDGTRTDHWKMDLPHAPYLFMIAVGDFAVVTDIWNDIPVQYYVEPAYKSHARKIFQYTPEMLDFFSKKCQFDFPWPKYAQIVVRDYMHGAMENTTAVVFGEFVQQTSQQLIDDPNDRIVAHELFHHWFGNLVTCESWANLVLNEGFANYGEYLWYEYKYGKDDADYILKTEFEGYLGQSVSEIHPLVDFHYSDKENMFDAHSYNKGGLVLHMLRNLVGDDAFWASINLFLEKNAFSDVEIHDLRLAFEKTTGKDLNWFFNQWYFQQGHPILDISQQYDPGSKELTIIVQQLQNNILKTDHPPYRLPLHFNIYTQEKTVPQIKSVFTNNIRDTFRFILNQQPFLVGIDPHSIILSETTLYRTEREWFRLYNRSSEFLDRYRAIQALEFNNNPDIRTVFQDALEDSSWVIRERAILNIEKKGDVTLDQKMRQLALSDPKSQVRKAALNFRGFSDTDVIKELAEEVIKKDSVQGVIITAFNHLKFLAPGKALLLAEKFLDTNNEQLLLLLGNLFADNPKSEYKAFFENNWSKISVYSINSFFRDYNNFLNKLFSEKEYDKTISFALEIVKNSKNRPFQRIAAARMLKNIKGNLEQTIQQNINNTETTYLQNQLDQLNRTIENLKATETNEEVKVFLTTF